MFVLVNNYVINIFENNTVSIGNSWDRRRQTLCAATDQCSEENKTRLKK